jgi:lipopolysaccharide biosynthesis regulator YciM
VDIPLWWLLVLPLFFACGWLAARIDIRHVMRESRAVPRSYFQGLNFLLNEQSDKAVEAFIEAARVDPETLDIHFALGNLFRRRGETDRAIRVHKNLVERDGLNEDQRLNALCELGQDYLKAGILDRAESIFLKLRHTARDEEALRHLLDVYQQEQEWEKAIACARDMPTTTDHLWHTAIAQFYCELAGAALLRGQTPQAREALAQAMAVNRKCVRASLLLGDIELQSGHPQAALAAWLHIEQQDPAYLALVGARWGEAWRACGQPGQDAVLLRGYLERYPTLDLLDAAFDAELKAQGQSAAYTLVRNELRRNPTLLGLGKLLEARALVVSEEDRDDLEMVKTLVHHHTRRVARYACRQCGFKARTFPWRCPACGGWETYPPKRTEEFDLTP